MSHRKASAVRGVLGVAKGAGKVLGVAGVATGAVLGGCRIAYEWGKECSATPQEQALTYPGDELMERFLNIVRVLELCRVNAKGFSDRRIKNDICVRD